MADVGKVWQINLNGKGIKVEDIPLRLIDPIAAARDISWFEVVNTPLAGSGSMILELVAVAAEYLGVEGPPDLTSRQVVDLLELVDDTVPVAEVVVETDPFASTGSTTEMPGEQP